MSVDNSTQLSINSSLNASLINSSLNNLPLNSSVFFSNIQIYPTTSYITANYYNKSYIDANIYNQSYITTNYYNKSYIDANIYTQSYITTNYYNKTSTDTLINNTSNNFRQYSLATFTSSYIQSASNNFMQYSLATFTSNYIQSVSNNFRQYSLATFTSNYIQSVNNNFNNYLPLSGGTISGTLNANTNLQEGGINLSTKYGTFTSNYSVILNQSTSNNLQYYSTINYLNIANSSNNFQYYPTINYANSIYPTLTANNTYSGIQTINNNLYIYGNVGIGTTNAQLKLDVNGEYIGRSSNIGSQHLTDKQGSLSIGRCDGTSSLNQTFTGIKRNVVSAASVGETYDNHTNIAFYTWGNNISVSREVMRINQRGNVGIGTTTPSNRLVVYGDYSILNGLRLSGSDTTNTIWNGNNNMAITVNSGYTVNIGMNGGNGNGILQIANSSITVNQPLNIATDIWHTSVEGKNRFYYASYGRSYCRSGDNTFEWTKSDNTALMNLDGGGTLKVATSLTVNDFIQTGIQGVAISSYWWMHVNNSIMANVLLFSYTPDDYSFYLNANTALSGLYYLNFTASDERIKDNIQDLEFNKEMIMSLKPKTYEMLNDNTRKNKFGFIAQDINNERLIKLETDYIANIFHEAIYDIETNIISCDKDLSFLKLNDIVKVITDHDGKSFDIYNWDSNFTRNYCKVIEIIDNNNFKIDIKLKDTTIFLNGTRTDDFRTLDYNGITTINTKAIQDLYNLIENQQNQINILSSNLMKG